MKAVDLIQAILASGKFEDEIKECSITLTDFTEQLVMKDIYQWPAVIAAIAIVGAAFAQVGIAAWMAVEREEEKCQT